MQTAWVLIQLLSLYEHSKDMSDGWEWFLFGRCDRPGRSTGQVLECGVETLSPALTKKDASPPDPTRGLQLRVAAPWPQTPP